MYTHCHIYKTTIISSESSQCPIYKARQMLLLSFGKHAALFVHPRDKVASRRSVNSVRCGSFCSRPRPREEKEGERDPQPRPDTQIIFPCCCALRPISLPQRLVFREKSLFSSSTVSEICCQRAHIILPLLTTFINYHLPLFCRSPFVLGPFFRSSIYPGRYSFYGWFDELGEDVHPDVFSDASVFSNLSDKIPK